MRLYSIDDITQKIESSEVIKETPKQYHLKGYLGAMSSRVSKSDPMLAFSPEEALEKYEAKQLDRISLLKRQIAYIQDKINKAKTNALH